MSRTSPNITDTEKSAYAAFCQANRIAVDNEAGEKNGELFAELIGVKMDSDFTQETLETAFHQLKSQLKFVSKTQTDADALARNLRPEEIDTYRAWVKNQRLLIGLDGSEEGYTNVKSLLGWMRGNPVTAHNLDLALGNIINNAQFGRIYFKPQPRADRAYGPGGRLNHAFGQKDEPAKSVEAQQEFHPNGRRNHAYKPTQDAAAKSAPAPDAWQQICQLHLKQWVTAGQRAKLEGEYNAGIASGKSWREIGTALGQIVKARERGR
jgi:hypothetical protein